MPQVFISYSQKDTDIARKLAKDLEKAGFDVWWDISDLKGGDAWIRAIQAALKASKYCLVILSPNSVESEWVEKEYTYAIGLGLKIIPILYKTCEVPMALANIQYIDFRGNKYDRGLKKLLTVLEAPPDTTGPDAEIPIYKLAAILTLSFISFVIIVSLFPRLFRCVLEYRMTEATVTLLAVLLSGAGVLFTRITTPRLQKVLYCMYGGIASALLLCVLVVKFSAPPPPDDCRDILASVPTSTPTPVLPTVTPSRSPTPELTSSSTLTNTLTPTLTATSAPSPAATPLTPTSAPSPTATPTPSPGPAPPERLSGKIAYPVYKNGRKYIFVAYFEDAGVRNVLFKEDAGEPAISPNGSEMAFRSWDDSCRGLMVMNIDGLTLRRVSRSLEDASPCWAQGESLVFHSTKEGPTPRLYTAGTWEGAEMVDSVQDVRRGTEPAHGQYPAWVPGGRIVYKYFEQSGNFRGLYVMNSDGSNPMPITDQAGDTMPSVSPRGDRVAFMSDRSAKWEVYVVNIDGSGLRQLTDSGKNKSGLPTWSPDGRCIAFVSERDNRWAVWVMKSDGSGQRKLFDLDGTSTWGERISWAP